MSAHKEDKGEKRERRADLIERWIFRFFFLFAVILCCILFQKIYKIYNILNLGQEKTEETIEESADAKEEVKVRIPDLVGLSIDNAKKYQFGYHITIEVSGYEESEEYTEGKIISQSIEPGTLSTETTVEVVVSSGKISNETMPDVTGIYESRAKSTLDDLDISYHQIYIHRSDYDRWIVCGQYPAAGEEITEDTEVILYVSQGY